VATFTERLALLISAKDDGATQTLNKVGGASAKAGTEVDKTTKKLGHMSTGMKVGVGLAAGFAARKLLQFSKDAIGAASDLAETQNKVAVTFGKSSAAVFELGKTSAKALGLSENAAESAAATLGGLFQTVGLATDASADMSVELVGLSADLASFHNAAGGAEEVLEAIRSGLSGESEPLRRFNVFLNEAAVKAKALELGLGGASGELTEGAKVQARYAIILEQTTAAQGDFARTSDGVANSQRIQNALFEDAKARMGKDLLPVQLKLTQAMIDLLPAIEGVGKGLAFIAGNDFARTIALGLAGMVVAGKGIGLLRDTMGQFGVEVGKADKATRFLGKGLAALAAVSLIDQAFGRSADELGRYTEKIEALAGTNVDAQIAAITAELEKQKDLAGKGVNLFNTFYSTGAAADAADKVEVLDERLKSLVHQKELDTIASKTGAAATGEAATATGEYAAELGEANKELDDAWAKQQRLNGVLLDAVEAQINFRDALQTGVQRIKDASKAGEDHARSLSLENQAGRDNVSWLTEQVRAANAHAESVLHQTRSVEKANKALRDDVVELKAAARAAGLNKEQVDKLINSYLKVPKKSETKIEQPGMKTAKSDTEGLKKKLEQVDGSWASTVNVSVTGLGLLGTLRETIRDLVGTYRANFIVSDSFAGGRQHGGPVMAGRAYIVGEKRPELFVPKQSGTIVPRVPVGAGRLVRVSDHGSSTRVVNVTVNTGGVVGMTKMDLENQLVAAVNRVAGQGRLDAAVRVASR